MTEITGVVIDTLNNCIEYNEYVSRDIKIFKAYDTFLLFANEVLVLETYSSDKLTEVIYTYYLEKGED